MTSTGLFSTASKETIDLLERLNREKKPIFVVPTKYISAEAAQVGYLLDTLYHANHAPESTDSYKSFFCNSRYEALQGAIKIARHRQWERYKEHGGKVLICDPTKAVNDYFLFQPEEPENFILPGVEMFESLEELEQRLSAAPVAACFVRLDNTFEPDELEGGLNRGLDRIRQQCARNEVRFAIDLSEMTLAETADFFRSANTGADLYIWGEQLTNREIPFGVFSMSDDTYTPWDNLPNCLLHSSTYSGNLLALNRVKQVLTDNFQWPVEVLRACSEMETSRESKNKYFSAHINPNLEKLYGLVGHDFDVQEASGCHLTIKEYTEEQSQVLLDCLSGGALGIFGHNPPDLPAAVLSKHDSSHDYWRDLTEEFNRLTGFEFAFPAVSGATAVENGMFTALLAQDPDKRKIVVFDQNYSGKLLLPLVASPFEAMPSYPFSPLYQQVVIIDAFGKDAEERLLSEIRSGGVGLIWFEYVRGSDGRSIPDTLIDVIAQHKETHGYYVGVDEILMGLYRSGPLLSYHRTTLRPDIVTLSKALTYMSFPIGATLVRSSLYHRAERNASRAIAGMKTRYVNQLGSHIALHCLKRLHEEDIPGNVEKQSRYLQDRLSRLADEYDSVDHIEMNGLFFRIYPKIPMTEEMLSYLSFLSKCWKRAGVFSLFDTRLMPSLCITEKEIDTLVDSAREVFGMDPWNVFRAGMRRNE